MWTQAAEDHFLSEHTNESTIEIQFINMQLDVSGVSIELPEEVKIDLPLPQ